MNRKIIFIFLILLSPLFWRRVGTEAFAQDTLDNSIEQKLENLAENSENEEDDYTSLIETLDFYRKHPINLNNTNPTQLAELGILDELQIENLLSHIDKNGRLLSPYELQSIDGFPTHTIKKLLPYIKVADITEEPPASLQEVMRKGNHEFTFRGQQVLEEQAGFSPIDSAGISESPNSRYIGSRQKIYSHYKFSYGNNVSAGITAEKDAGELFFRNNKKFNSSGYDSLLNGEQKTGFDFYSAHFFIKNIRFIKALAIGDYQVGFGQGLTSWSGLAYGKSSEAVNIKRTSSGIRPYTSVDENRFMRGVAITAGTNQLQATGFFSRKKLDANIIYSDSSNTSQISSLQTTGLHSTPSEISDRNAVTQTILGGNISYKKRKYSFGLTAMHTLFDVELKRSTSTYNQFEFSGKQLTNLGADYSFLLRNFNFFGEVSFSAPNVLQVSPEGGDLEGAGLAVLNGCIISLDPKLSLSLLHRSYQRNFHSLSANAFSESSKPANEQGFYVGITAQPTSYLNINAYYDHFKFPWLKYQVDAPSSGSEFVVQINYAPSKKLDTYIRVRQKDKFVNSSSDSDIDFISPYKQVNYRWHIGYKVSQSLKLSNRVEYILLEKENSENGYLIYQDATYKKTGSKISFTLRYALFDTKNYDTRIYAYENDIPGTYSIPAYYNKGSRVYVMLNYNITRNLELWLRWSQTYYSNQSLISAGTLNEIQGHSKSEVKVQIKLKL